MTKQELTAGGIGKIKAGTERREIHDSGCKGLHLVIQPSGLSDIKAMFERMRDQV